MKNLFKKTLLFMLVMAGVQVYSNDRIDDFRIGLGGVYGLYQADKQQDITNTGGYLVIVGRESYANKRIYAEAGGDLFALGTSKYKGGKSETFYAYDGRVKFGVNIASQANPLFLNVVYNFDNQIIEGVGEYFQTGLHTAGLDLQGFIKSGEKTTYEYNVGYYYVFHGYHYLDKIRSGINDYSYAIKGYIGYTYQLSPKVAYFINAKAKYYDIATSNFNTPTFNRPKTKHLMGMVEIGLQF